MMKKEIETRKGQEQEVSLGEFLAGWRVGTIIETTPLKGAEKLVGTGGNLQGGELELQEVFLLLLLTNPHCQMRKGPCGCCGSVKGQDRSRLKERRSLKNALKPCHPMHSSNNHAQDL
jgi:hypothetical protein